uniref:NADH-ubiquinone oxidoreductase chain 4 n=1 Tax=Rhodosoma turcicum TaxID=1256665 RepID=S0DGV4_9ASCI|nr:NADH dehydrogenase subunit 4 [Rhodosoma turcicum]CCO25803.1 NADH dehydrogenase subunit 4 [Rhodosoma turcicum]
MVVNGLFFSFFVYSFILFKKGSSEIFFWFIFYLNFFLLWSLKLLLETSECVFTNHYSSMLVLDKVSCVFLVLTIWVMVVGVCSMLYVDSRVGDLVVGLVILHSLLVFFFFSCNLLNFFLFFELSVVPLFWIISYWGSQKERFFSNYYFILYTVVSSSPFLLIVLSSMLSGVVSGVLIFFSSKFFVTGACFLGLMVGFYSKLPLFGFHIWLPKAHVDAPVGGSMLLAGILLKLGSLGAIRVLSLLGFGGFFVIKLSLVLASWGFFVASVMCLRLTDLKVIIAFSSVSHMSLALGGLVVLSGWGLKGGFLVFLGHGIISPALFYLGNMIYSRGGSRTLSGMKSLGIMNKFYLFVLVFFLFNVGLPPFVNFFGELGIFFSMFFYAKFLVGVVFLGFFFSGLYMIMLVVSLVGSKTWFRLVDKFFFLEWVLLVYMFFSYVWLSLGTELWF